MQLHVAIPVQAAPETIWSIVTDIEHATGHISGIEAVEILERPPAGLVGLKWRETRTLFGKTAEETMWITEAEPNRYYRTRAESHGSVYTTELRITPTDDGQANLGMTFGAKAQSLGARILSFIFGLLAKNATRKALLQDLEDIKAVAEQRAAEPA